MADFTAANAALAELQTTVTEVVAALQNDDQSSVDALTAGISGAQSQLAGALPAPPPPPAA